MTTKTDQRPRRWRRIYRRISLVLCVIALTVVYLLLPAFAALYELGDRRGPKIYPQALHQAIYDRVRALVGDDVPPRGAKASERPWFYGTN